MSNQPPHVYKQLVISRFEIERIIGHFKAMSNLINQLIFHIPCVKSEDEGDYYTAIILAKLLSEHCAKVAADMEHELEFSYQTLSTYFEKHDDAGSK